VGDIYTDDMGCRYQICGILPAGFQFPPNGLFQTELPYENMDDKLVTLYDSRLISSSPYITNASQTIYCLTDGSVETEERIESLAKSCFIYIKMDTIDQKIEQYKQEEKWYLQITALFTGITVLAAFLAMISSSIIQIILKKQEYGILYANGVSKWDGIRLIAIKNVILQGVAFLLATLYVAKKIGKETIYYAPQQLSIFYQFTIWKTLLVVLLLSLISTVIPALVLNRLKLVKLLGGNEL
jgi:ABC-type antimicrobial peptide transport system permease subunit